MKTQVNITSGVWHSEILVALKYAFDPINQGATVTLERNGVDPTRVYGLGKNIGGDATISLLVDEDRHRILINLTDKIYLNN